MADVQKEIALKVTTDTSQTTTGFKSVKQELKETKKALVELAMAGKQGTEEFKRLEQRAGAIEDTIGDMNTRVKNLANDTPKLEMLTQAATGIAGGFAIAQGAAALFGDENEELQQAILKTQGGMALLNGVQSIANVLNKDAALGDLLGAKAQAVYTAPVGASTGGLKAFRIALVATGIGAVVVLVGLLVANWEKLTNAINPASKALKDYNKQSEKAEEISKKRAAATDLEIRRLKALGVGEIELMRIKRAAVEQEIKDTDRRLAAQQKVLELSIEQFYKQRADVAQGTFGAVGELITNFFGVSNEDLEKLSDKLDEVKAVRKELGVEVLEIDSDITKKIDDENGKRIQQQISALENQKAIAAAAGQDTFKLDVEISQKRIQLAKETNGDIAKAEADLQVLLIAERTKALALQEELSKITKETEDQKVEARKSAQQKLDEINNQIRRSQLTEYQREREDFLLQRAQMLELMRASGVAEIELQLFAQNTIRLSQQMDSERELALLKETEEKKRLLRQENINKSAQMTMDSLSALNALYTSSLGQSEKDQRRAFEANKKFSIAQALISTFLAVNNALTAGGNPIKLATGAQFVEAGIALTAGLANVIKIRKTTFQSTSAPSSSSVSAPAAGGGGGQLPPAAFNPNVTPTNPTGQPNPQGGQSGTTRVIVVESDIRRVTTRVDAAERFATFGN